MRAPRERIRSAETLGDVDTADVFTQASRTADSLLWKIISHFAEAWERGPREVIVLENNSSGR